MAIFHHSMKNGKKNTAHEHCAYNTRSGKKYEARHDLIYTTHRNIPNDDPPAFWNAADKFERANGTAYREHEIAIPAELTLDAQIKLVNRLADELVPGKPCEISIHCGESSIEGCLNPHVHMMFSDRVPDGLGRPLERIFKRANSQQPELGGWRKDSGGRDRAQMKELARTRREIVANTINEALAEAGIKERVDHRSLRDQGIDRQPERHLGPAAVKAMSAEDKASHIDMRRRRA